MDYQQFKDLLIEHTGGVRKRIEALEAKSGRNGDIAILQSTNYIIALGFNI